MGSAATPGDDRSDRDEVKRRFKEALERKNGRHAGGAAAGESGEHARVHGGAHGPAHQQRQFRRKSG